MTSRNKLIAVGVVVFLLGSIRMFPARLAYSWFAPEQITLDGIAGTIWSGNAAEGLAEGFYFTDLQWSFRPLALFTGVAAFDTSVKTSGGRLSMTAGIGIGGSLSLADLTGSLSLASVHPALQQNRVSGLLNVQMQAIEIKNGWPTRAIGSIGIGNLVAGAIGPDSLGNFRADFTTENGSISALVEDAGAVLNVRGNIALSEDRAYSLVGSVSANDDTPPIINQSLRFLGTPDQNGQREFRFEGSL